MALRIGIKVLDYIDVQDYKLACQYLKENYNDELKDELYIVANDLFDRLILCFGCNNVIGDDLYMLTAYVLTWTDRRARFIALSDYLTAPKSIPLTYLLLDSIQSDVDFIFSNHELWISFERDVLPRVEQYILELLDEENIENAYRKKLIRKLASKALTFQNNISSSNKGLFLHVAIRLLSDKNKSKLSTEEAKEFMRVVFRAEPFHPIVVASSSTDYWLPSVYSSSYSTSCLVEVLSRYAATRNNDKLSIESIHKTLIMVVEMSPQLGRQQLTSYERLIIALMHYLDEFTLGDIRMEFVKLSMKIITAFDDVSRALLLKRLIHCAVEGCVEGDLASEPMFISWFLGLWRANLNIPIFQEETGSVWTLLSKIKYAEPAEATSFYTSLYLLAQQQALLRFKRPLMQTVRDKILPSFHAQMTDYMQIRKMKSETTEKNDDPFHNELEEQTEGCLNLIIFNWKQAKLFMEAFLNEQ